MVTSYKNGVTVIADRQKVIVVSVAYRLGVFGFAHNSAFLGEDGILGNWGSLDQRMAMVWVQKYIHNIGGDPKRVTISGCSAGGQSTMLHLTSPNSWPYFSRVLDFSGPNGVPYKNVSEAETINSEFVRRAGCCSEPSCKVANVECLRSKTTKEIQRAAWGRFTFELDDPEKVQQAGEPWSPVIDGQILVDHPFNLISKGEIRPQTEVVYGNQLEEAYIFIPKDQTVSLIANIILATETQARTTWVTF